MIDIPKTVFKGNPQEPIKGDLISAEDILAFDQPEEGGVYMYLKNVPFPFKGMPFSDIVESIGIPKRILKSSFRVMRRFKWLLLLYPIRKRILKKLLEEYLDISNAGALSRLSLDPIRFCTCVREIYFKAIKFNQNVLWQKTVYLACMILEFDNAYRFRLQDLLMETNLKALRDNPRKETKRLAELMADRELRVNGKENLRFYWRQFLKYGGIYLWLNPKTKKLVCDYLDSLEMEKIKFDEIDLYYIYARTERNYIGIEFTERLEMRKALEKQGCQMTKDFMKRLESEKLMKVGLPQNK